MHRNDSTMDASDTLVNDSDADKKLFIPKLRGKPNLDLRVLGVCTGSSLDELDLAFVRYVQDTPHTPLYMEVLQHGRLPVHPSVKSPILNLLRDSQIRPYNGAALNVLLGKMFAVGIKIFCHIHKVVGTSIDFIGTHAPTLLKQYRYVGTETANNHPLAWTGFVRAETGLTVVSGFSIVENGSVTPHVSPVAFVDRVLLRHRNKFRACLNINDLVNISFIPPFTDTSSRATVARDCGPGSLLIDYAMRYCTSNGQTQDHNGTYAANGTVNENIVTRFLDTKDYLRVAPPLHIAREMFGDHEAQRLVDECLFSNMQEADIVATITRITAQNILKQYHRLLELNFPAGQEVDEMFVCGPSAENSNIVDYLEAELPDNVITKPLDDIGIPGDANQAVCYAHLALEAVLKEASVALDPALRSEEAACEDAVRGRIVRGERWEQVVKKIQQFGGGEQLRISRDVRVGSLAAGFNGLDLR